MEKNTSSGTLGIGRPTDLDEAPVDFLAVRCGTVASGNVSLNHLAESRPVEAARQVILDLLDGEIEMVRCDDPCVRGLCAPELTNGPGEQPQGTASLMEGRDCRCLEAERAQQLRVERVALLDLLRVIRAERTLRQVGGLLTKFPVIGGERLGGLPGRIGINVLEEPVA